jgi:hypothetical protein
LRHTTTGTIHDYPNQETANEHGKPQRPASQEDDGSRFRWIRAAPALRDCVERRMRCNMK